MTQGFPEEAPQKLDLEGWMGVRWGRDGGFPGKGTCDGKQSCERAGGAGTGRLARLCLCNGSWCAVGASCFTVNALNRKRMASGAGEVTASEGSGVRGQGGWFLSHWHWGTRCTVFRKRISDRQISN